MAFSAADLVLPSFSAATSPGSSASNTPSRKIRVYGARRATRTGKVGKSLFSSPRHRQAQRRPVRGNEARQVLVGMDLEDSRSDN